MNVFLTFCDNEFKKHNHLFIEYKKQLHQHFARMIVCEESLLFEHI